MLFYLSTKTKRHCEECNDVAIPGSADVNHVIARYEAIARKQGELCKVRDCFVPRNDMVFIILNKLCKFYN